MKTPHVLLTTLAVRSGTADWEVTPLIPFEERGPCELGSRRSRPSLERRARRGHRRAAVSFESVHPQVSVSAVSSRQWTLDEDLAFWSEAGIDHVGLSLRKLEAAGIDDAARADRRRGPAREQHRRARLVGSPRRGDVAAPAGPAARRRRRRGRRSAGASCSPPGPAHPMEWDDAVGAPSTPRSRRCATTRRARGVPLTVEPTSPLRLDLSFCTTFARRRRSRRALGIGLCVECNSSFAERDLVATLAGAADVLAHVQVSDFVIGSLRTPDRAVPGDGDIPLGRIARRDPGASATTARTSSRWSGRASRPRATRRRSSAASRRSDRSWRRPASRR